METEAGHGAGRGRYRVESQRQAGTHEYKKEATSLILFIPPTSVMQVTAEKLHTLAQDSKQLMEVIQQELKELQARLKLHAHNTTQICQNACKLQQCLVPTFLCKRKMAAAPLLPLNTTQNVSCDQC